MKIDLTQSIKDYEGQDVKENDKPLQLRSVFATALNQTSVNENGQPEVLMAEQKARIYHLSVKLYQADEVNLTLEERSLIKERVGKVYSSPLLYGRICDILEGEDDTDQA